MTQSDKRAISDEMRIRIVHSFGTAITFHFHWPVTVAKKTKTPQQHTSKESGKTKIRIKKRREKYVYIHIRKIIASTVATFTTAPTSFIKTMLTISGKSVCVRSL